MKMIFSSTHFEKLKTLNVEANANVFKNFFERRKLGRIDGKNQPMERFKGEFA